MRFLFKGHDQFSSFIAKSMGGHVVYSWGGEVSGVTSGSCDWNDCDRMGNKSTNQHVIVKRMWWDYLGFRQFFNILTFNHCSSDCPHKNLFQKQVQAEFTSLSLHDTTSSWYTWVGLSCWRHNKMPMFATTLGNRSRIYTCSLTTPPLMTLMSHSVSSSICSACHKWHGDRDTLPSN